MSHSCGFTRRRFLTTAALGSLALYLRGYGEALANTEPKGPHDKPEDALIRLKQGNERFFNDQRSFAGHLTKQRMQETAQNGQHPFATIISCSDSRAPVEEIFDQGIGDLFSIRIAGNVVHTDEVGTTEYGVLHLATPLIVVMGHTKCGAVTAVVNGEQVAGSIPQLVETIAPAAARAKAKGLTGDALVSDAIRENIKESIDGLLKASDEIAALVNQGRVMVVGALYHLEDGKVEWL